MYEIMFNILKKNPRLIHINREFAEAVARVIPNWKHFNQMEIIKDKLDITVNPNARKIDELYVNPVNFNAGAEEHLFRDAEDWPDHPEKDEG